MKDYLLVISETISPDDALKVRNAEIRRYLITKRIGYEQIKKNLHVVVIHDDGSTELLSIGDECFVKVKDSSTEREYLLAVPKNLKTCHEAIAWTFNMWDEEYNPILET